MDLEHRYDILDGCWFGHFIDWDFLKLEVLRGHPTALTIQYCVFIGALRFEDSKRNKDSDLLDRRFKVLQWHRVKEYPWIVRIRL
jgi:hypothetical protein